MIAEYFKSPARIQSLHNGHSGSLVEGFAQDLWEAGYAKITARRHIRAAEHFIYWATKEAYLAAVGTCCFFLASTIT